MDTKDKNDIKYILLSSIFALIVLFALSFYLPLKENPKENKDNIDLNKDLNIEMQALNECQSLCKENISKLKNKENGPCLSDIFEYSSKDYVCDIAHSPRLDVDNKEENQCKEFLDNKKSHFIELNDKCELIRIK